MADGYTRCSSPPYDRELGDLLMIQDELAYAVIRELSPTLGIDSAAWSYGGTQSVDAYTHFLRGIREAAQVDPAAAVNAVNAFREAVARDAGYGEAWTRLGIALGTRCSVWPKKPRLSTRRADGLRAARAGCARSRSSTRL